MSDGKSRSVAIGALSRATTYNLIVTGPYGPQEITNLIRRLEIDREFLRSDETNERRDILDALQDCVALLTGDVSGPAQHAACIANARAILARTDHA